MKKRNQSGKALSRRRFLHGCGVALSLPWMASLSSKAVRAAETGIPPVRSAFLYFPNGVWEKDWIPKESGDKYELTPSLKPLEDVRDVSAVPGLRFIGS